MLEIAGCRRRGRAGSGRGTAASIASSAGTCPPAHRLEPVQSRGNREEGCREAITRGQKSSTVGRTSRIVTPLGRTAPTWKQPLNLVCHSLREKRPASIASVGTPARNASNVRRYHVPLSTAASAMRGTTHDKLTSERPIFAFGSRGFCHAPRVLSVTDKPRVQRFPKSLCAQVTATGAATIAAV